MSRPPLPPYTAETAAQKVRLAEDAWNTRPSDGGGFMISNVAWHLPTNNFVVRVARLAHSGAGRWLAEFLPSAAAAGTQ